MNRLLLLALLAGLLSSCSVVTTYQVAEVRYTGTKSTPTPETIDHGDLQLRYDLWGDGGQLRCQIHNFADDPIIVDLQRSSVIVNGQSYPYVKATKTNFQSEANGGLAPSSANSRSNFSQVTIPPQSFVTLSHLGLSYTTAPLNVSQKESGQELSDPPGFGFRHYVTYYRADQASQLQFIDDAFEVENAWVMNETDFQQQVPMPLRFYASHSVDDDMNNAGGAVVLIVVFTGFLAYIANQPSFP
jgi:hypothetical protein